MANYPQQVRTDRFGNDTILKRSTKGKVKGGGRSSDFQYTYIEIGGKSYKIEVSNCNKPAKSDASGDYWIKVTKYTKNQSSSKSF